MVYYSLPPASSFGQFITPKALLRTDNNQGIAKTDNDHNDISNWVLKAVILNTDC